jgi:MFS family permease
MLGLGMTLAYMPTLGYINEWFVQRRGLANGIMFGGAGVTGLVLPILFEKSLAKIGYQMTLRIWSIVMAFILLPSVHFLIRGRLPDSQRTARRRSNLAFFKNPVFLLVASANFLQGLAFFIPTIYLPSYAADLQIPAIQSTLLLSFLNLSNTLGQAFTGFLSDRLGSTIPFFLSTLIGGLSICIIWGLSKSFVPLVVFSFVYGLSAGGYSVLYPKFALEVAADDPHTQLVLVGFLYFERYAKSPLRNYDLD